jgi:hypothetical protein
MLFRSMTSKNWGFLLLPLFPGHLVHPAQLNTPGTLIFSSIGLFLSRIFFTKELDSLSSVPRSGVGTDCLQIKICELYLQTKICDLRQFG